MSAIENHLANRASNLEPVNTYHTTLEENQQQQEDFSEDELHEQDEDIQMQDQPEAEPIDIEEVDGGVVDILDQCAICQEELNKRNGESAYLDCMHWYHFECIKPWLLHKRECPTCKHEANHIFKIYDENNPLQPDGEPSDLKQPEQTDNPFASQLTNNSQEPVDGTGQTRSQQNLDTDEMLFQPGVAVGSEIEPEF